MPKMKKDFERVNARLRTLETMPIDELRALWAKYFRSPAPPHYQRLPLARRIGYHLQAMAYGGLDKSSRQRIKRLAKNPDTQSPTLHTIAPGTCIIKEWNGKRLVVEALNNRQFRFEGRIYKSLSAIASEVAGCRKSGNYFFGITKKRFPA